MIGFRRLSPGCRYVESMFCGRPAEFASSLCSGVVLLPPAQSVGVAGETARRVRLVPCALELLDFGAESPGSARYRRIGRNGTTLAAPLGLALETGQTGGERQ